MPLADAAGLLQAWEDASPLPMQERALRLAAVANEPAPLDAITHWTVRRRDAALFDVRLRHFGRFADGLVPCPHCAEPLEMRLDLVQLRCAPRADDERPRQLRVGDVAITWRLPTAADLVAAGAEDDDDRARARLLACCVSSATRGSDALDVHDILAHEPAVGARVADAIAAEYGDVPTSLAIACPACGRGADVPFAIETFLWREVDAWARRTLQEVHALARAYGWSERDILALSSARRRLYLEMAAPA